MRASAISFGVYRRRATRVLREILADGHRGEFDEQALPAYSHWNPLMRWLFWQRLRRVVRHLKSTVPAGSRVLDFGCGVGVLLPLLAAQGIELTAVDLDIRHTARFLDYFGVSVERIAPSAMLPDLPAEHYDAITALDVLEHVPDLGALLIQLKRLLRPEGKLIVCGPTENLFYRIGRWLAGFSGHYHLRSIGDIHTEVRQHFDARWLGTLYGCLPLFRLFEATASTAQPSTVPSP